MRSLSPVFLLPAFLILCLAPLASFAQPKPIHCTTQPPAAVTDADRAFAAGDAAHAESLYIAQLAATPSFSNYAGIVKSQLEQNKLTEAMATAQRATAAMPASADAQTLIGEVLIRSGQIPEASAAYAKAVNQDQCSARAHFGLGRLNNLVSRHLTAAHELTTAHMLTPGDAEITAVWLETLPDAQRAAVLKALLAMHPNLTPATIDRLATELAILDQHKSCTLVEAPSSVKIELAPLMFNGKFELSWGLNVRLGENATELLELDSSVSGIVLSQKDAQRAGVHPLTVLPANPDAPYTAVADHVHIGALDYRDCPVRVVPAAALAGANSLIGTDFFRDHLIRIDYVAQLLTLSAYPARPGAGPNDLADQVVAPTQKDWSQVYIAGGNILLPTLINKKGPYLFLLDTGTWNTILAPGVTASLLSAGTDATLNLRGISADIIKVVPRDGGANLDTTDVHGPTGAVLHVTRPVKLPTYRFTSNERVDRFAISFDISPKSHDTGIEVTGVLGFGVLKEFFLDIDYRNGLVRILYDQQRRYELREAEKGILYGPLQ